MSSNSASTSAPPSGSTVSALPQETLEFAAKVFDLARNGNDQTLATYLTAGLPPNLTNDKGNTLLMLAAYAGHASTVRLLHSKGADVNRLNDRQQSPLAGAIFKNESEVVKALVELGADPRKGDPSAIQAAKIFGQTQMLDWLGATDEERAAPSPAARAKGGTGQ